MHRTLVCPFMSANFIFVKPPLVPILVFGYLYVHLHLYMGRCVVQACLFHSRD